MQKHGTWPERFTQKKLKIRSAQTDMVSIIQSCKNARVMNKKKDIQCLLGMLDENNALPRKLRYTLVIQTFD